MRSVGETLYRGVTFDPEILEDQDTFTAAITAPNGLAPGSLKINDRGERCVSTGDEYGLYMTPSTQIAESYAIVDEAAQQVGMAQPYLANGEPVNFRIPDEHFGSIETRLAMPSLGAVYSISTAGLPGLRLPRYREGRHLSDAELTTIPEWIADEAPATNVRLKSLHIGPYIIDDISPRFIPDGDETTLYRRVKSLYSSRLGSLAFLSQQLRSRPDENDLNDTMRVISLARSLR
ncbi:MAG TPA: hypothetical protein VLA92_01920 [Candidatus Saccharimonadales bacterium]|nr:hypothetical protein [Candidatus Saccharimonadales bacterium]